MNFTSYESGFGVGSRGNSAIGQGAQQHVNIVGKSNRLYPNQFDQAGNLRSGVTAQGANSVLLKQQQVNPLAASTIYGNLSN